MLFRVEGSAGYRRFGSDRVNGRCGPDRVCHVAAGGHGADEIEDVGDAEGDRLVRGGAATASQIEVSFANTAGAGDSGTDEAFVIYRPNGQILWALVDGAVQGAIDPQIVGRSTTLLPCARRPGRFNGNRVGHIHELI
jgi:hypothetical protein